jgi:hypothetical protein
VQGIFLHHVPEEVTSSQNLVLHSFCLVEFIIHCFYMDAVSVCFPNFLLLSTMEPAGRKHFTYLSIFIELHSSSSVCIVRIHMRIATSSTVASGVCVLCVCVCCGGGRKGRVIITTETKENDYQYLSGKIMSLYMLWYWHVKELYPGAKNR